jgi:hypothetical protein
MSTQVNRNKATGNLQYAQHERSIGLTVSAFICSKTLGLKAQTPTTNPLPRAGVKTVKATQVPQTEGLGM